jgi:hypothetical protein
MSEDFLKKLTKDHSKPRGHDLFQFKTPRKALSYLKNQLSNLLNKNNNQNQGGNAKGFDHGLDPLRQMFGQSDSRPTPPGPKPQESTRSQAANNIKPFSRPSATNNSAQIANQQKMLRDIQAQRQQATQQQASQNNQKTLNQQQIKERSSF